MLNKTPIDWCSKNQFTIEKNNMWIRALINSNLYGTDPIPSNHLKVLMSTHPKTYLHFRRQ